MNSLYFKFNIWALSKDRTEFNLTNYFYKVLEKKMLAAWQPTQFRL